MARGIPRRRVRWNLSSFEDIRKAPEVEAEVGKVVRRIQDAVEARDWGNYEGGTEDGGDRVRGYVVTADFAAMQAEASEHPLSAALANEEGL